MKRELTVPLYQSQIEAAWTLSQKLSLWMQSNRSLDLLLEKCPGLSLEEILLKTVTINSLYGTNIYAVHAVASHFFTVLNDLNLDTSGPELVERLAVVQLKSGSKPKRLHSFASKYAHRFIDRERFPIIDRFAEIAVKRHLGKLIGKSTDKRYIRFHENVQLLRELAGVNCGGEKFDRYLWLAGAYRVWEDPKQQIAAEAALLFDKAQATGCHDFKAMFGATT